MKPSLQPLRRPYPARAMPRARTSRLLRPFALLLAACAADAGAISINAAVDNGPYFCSAATDIQFTVEDGPIWSWTCGTPDLVVCMQSEPAGMDLEDNLITLSCFQMAPSLEPPVFRDDFEE
jgi:hypothetical protein